MTWGARGWAERMARAALWLAGLAIAGLLWRAFSGALHAIGGADPGARLGLAAAALLPTVLLLLAMILAQMLGRMRSGAVDPTAGRDTAFLRTNQRVITNTVEQLAAFAPALLALAAGSAPSRIGQVVALGLVFAIARLGFWIGYLARPTLRAPGMTATFALNVVTAIAAVWVWLT